MHIVLVNKTTMAITDITNVSNIALSGTNYAVTVSGVTTNYATGTWYLQILWI